MRPPQASLYFIALYCLYDISDGIELYLLLLHHKSLSLDVYCSSLLSTHSCSAAVLEEAFYLFPIRYTRTAAYIGLY